MRRIAALLLVIIATIGFAVYADKGQSTPVNRRHMIAEDITNSAILNKIRTVCQHEVIHPPTLSNCQILESYYGVRYLCNESNCWVEVN